MSDLVTVNIHTSLSDSPVSLIHQPALATSMEVATEEKGNDETSGPQPAPEVLLAENDGPIVGSFVPLPNKDPPARPMLPRLARNLCADGILAEGDRDRVLHLIDTEQPLQAAVALLQAWKAADELGRHPSNGRRIYQPDTAKYPGLKASTFRPDILEMMGSGEQVESIAYLVDGMCHGFRITAGEAPIEFDSVTYENVPIDEPIAAKAIADGIKLEANLGCIGRRQAHMIKFISSPIFPVQKKKDGRLVEKYRQAHNQSKTDGVHPAVNDYVSKEEATISYESVQTGVKYTFELKDEARRRYTAHMARARAARQRSFGRLPDSQEQPAETSSGAGTAPASGAVLGKNANGVWVASSVPFVPDIRYSKLDAERAFRIFPLHESCYALLGFRDAAGNYWFESRLCFGLRIAPRMYSCLSNTIAWLFKHCFGISAVVVYIDDFLLISIDEADSALATQAALLVFALLGLPVQMEKFEQNSSAMVFLGVEMDARNETLRLPPAKLEALMEMITEWRSKTSATSREIMRLTGSLIHASRVINAGRLFLNRLFRKICYGRAKDRGQRFAMPMVLGAEFAKDMDWWAAMLPHCNRASRMIDKRFPLLASKSGVTDASDWGGGGVNVLRRTFWQAPWIGLVAYMSPRHGTHINVREAWALPADAMMNRDEWATHHVIMHCDNKSDVDAVTAGRSKNAHTLHFMRVLYFISVIYNFTFDIVYIPTTENMADKPSRVCSSEWLQDEPPCSPLRTRLPVPWYPPHWDDPAWEADLLAQASAALAARK